MDFKEVYQYTKFLSVLYVEDDELMLNQTTDIFKTFFFNVITAKDGEEGLSKYIDYKEKNGKYIDLVITDIVMPNKDGLSMIKDIGQMNKEQPIIVVSAHHESDLLISLIQYGITNFIMKPFVSGQLLKVLYETCYKIHIKKENIRLEIEKQIQIEQKNIQHHKMLAMADMIDNIAHQYRQPLSVITTLASSMKFDKELGNFNEDRVIEYCDMINENAQYLSQVIDDFKAFVNNDDKKSFFNIYELVSDLISKQSRLLNENKIEIIFDFDDSLIIGSRPNLLIQALLNILLNAIEVLSKIDKKRYIFVNVSKQHDEYVIEIKDNAGGINEGIISKVFEIYFTTKHRFVGTGLGLYITYNIITRELGGTIEVVNEKYIFNDIPQEGAKFKISLPYEND